jgi:CheY-like chemotaxis protein
MELLAGDDLVILTAATGGAALATLSRERPDLVVAAVDLSDMRAHELVEHIGRSAELGDTPVVAYAFEPPPPDDDANLTRMSETRILRYARNVEHLYDEATLFLHRPVSAMPPARRAMVEGLHYVNAMLAGRKVLIVDDDIRNIFALTTLLEPHDMVVIAAETGSAAIEMIERTPDVDIVLMDIMMPQMDGYDTMRAIREQDRFRNLPIVALTAKAMKGDREKCIEAGATDYVSKPVDPEHLLSVLRVWLTR